ncbi:MAG: energy transducer TonB [Myxococcales bacterium]|nr:energy transducer TonB [Myxococcales bacterium]
MEGWVCLEFTVTSDGTVAKPRVLASAPEGYFEAPALAAVRQWRYRPFREGGKSIQRPGVRVMLTFEIAE